MERVSMNNIELLNDENKVDKYIFMENLKIIML